jgi:hypothetical protein
MKNARNGKTHQHSQPSGNIRKFVLRPADVLCVSLSLSLSIPGNCDETGELTAAQETIFYREGGEAQSSPF